MSDVVEAWQQRHPGVHANRLVRLWLTSLDPIAQRLDGVDPDLVTAAGAAAAIAAAVVPRPAGAALIVAGGVLDGLDGMVAGGPSARGERLDHLADRVADAALLAALARAGAPPALAAAALVAVLGQELGRGDAVIVTPGERPTRVVLGVLGLLTFPTPAAGAIGAVSALSWLLLRRSRRI